MRAFFHAGSVSLFIPFLNDTLDAVPWHESHILREMTRFGSEIRALLNTHSSTVDGASRIDWDSCGKNDITEKVKWDISSHSRRETLLTFPIEVWTPFVWRRAAWKVSTQLWRWNWSHSWVHCRHLTNLSTLFIANYFLKSVHRSLRAPRFWATTSKVQSISVLSQEPEVTFNPAGGPGAKIRCGPPQTRIPQESQILIPSCPRFSLSD